MDKNKYENEDADMALNDNELSLLPEDEMISDASVEPDPEPAESYQTLFALEDGGENTVGDAPLAEIPEDVSAEEVSGYSADGDTIYTPPDEETDEAAEDAFEHSDEESAEGSPDGTDAEGIGEASDEEAQEDENDVAAEQKNGDKQIAPKKINSIFDFIELFVFTLAAVFIVTSFFFRYSIVDGESMQNTLQNDERLILSSFLYTPECGDVIVVQDKSTALKDPIVKRVIAVGGQRVRFTRTDVYVDGVKLDEPYVYTEDYVNQITGETDYKYSVYPSSALLPIVCDRVDGEYYEILVPEGEIFVMGDHRNNSKDSRDIGTLHEDAVIGKVVLRFYPFEQFGKIE